MSWQRIRGRLELKKGMDGLSKPKCIMNKFLLFVHTFFI
jgi:hypothetical protein